MKRPLDWPPGAARTRANLRWQSGERRNYIEIRDSILRGLHRHGVGEIFLSTDAPDRLQGTPVGVTRPLGDPGVVLYFALGPTWHAYVSDRFSDRIGNMGRVAYMVTARKRPMILTHLRFHQQPRPGTFHDFHHFRDYDFRDFHDPPEPPPPPPRPMERWWRDLGLTSPPESLSEAETAFREQVKVHHPDRGGDDSKMRLAIVAVERARENRLWPPP